MTSTFTRGTDQSEVASLLRKLAEVGVDVADLETRESSLMSTRMSSGSRRSR